MSLTLVLREINKAKRMKAVDRYKFAQPALSAQVNDIGNATIVLINAAKKYLVTHQ